MSFLSVLGKIGKYAGLGAAGLATGGAAWIPMAASIAGDLAKGASKQRAEDRGAQAEYDGLRVPIQNSQALQYAQARHGADRSRMGQIAGADMLGNFKTSSDPRAQKLQNNGQLRGGQINPETVQMMRARAMQALESGSDVPQMQQLPEQPGGGATGMDTFLNTLSGVGTGLGALRESGIFNTPQPTPGQSGPINLPAIPNVGALPNDDRPWWLKQPPPTMGGN